MENKVRIKNGTSYDFDDIIKLEDFNLHNILIDEKSHGNILIYNISYKTLIDPKPLCIRFNKVDGFIRSYDGTRYLTLFGSEKYDAIYNKNLEAKKVASHISFLTILQKSKFILMILYL